MSWLVSWKADTMTAYLEYVEEQPIVKVWFSGGAKPAWKPTWKPIKGYVKRNSN